MRKLLTSFQQNESGATSIEYALIASLIFLVILASVTALGGEVSGLFTRTANSVTAAAR